MPFVCSVDRLMTFYFTPSSELTPVKIPESFSQASPGTPVDPRASQVEGVGELDRDAAAVVVAGRGGESGRHRPENEVVAAEEVEADLTGHAKPEVETREEQDRTMEDSGDLTGHAKPDEDELHADMSKS